MVDADTDPAMVGGDVVDAIGRHLAKLGDLEIMYPHRFWLALGTQLTPGDGGLGKGYARIS